MEEQAIKTIAGAGILFQLTAPTFEVSDIRVIRYWQLS